MLRLALGLTILVALVASPAVAQERRDTTLSSVSGRVIDHETDRSVPGARVFLDPAYLGLSSPGSQTTGEDGRFNFEGIVSGDYSLRVTALGYQPLADSIYVIPSSDVRLALYVSVSPLVLQPIMAVAPHRPAFMDGFEERRADATVHMGFFTREEIEERHPRDIPDLLKAVPGVYEERSLIGRSRIRVVGNPALKGTCAPRIFVNGKHSPYVDYARIYDMDNVEAVEVYATGNHTPEEFRWGSNSCGALVVWLREPDPWESLEEPAKKTKWKTLAGWAAALGALGFLLS